MAGNVMIAENLGAVHIFLPYEIVKVDTVSDNLFAVTYLPSHGRASLFFHVKSRVSSS